MYKQIISASLIALMLTACQTDQYGQPVMNKQGVGTVVGAIGGAALGSQFGGGTGRVVGIAAGTLLGAALGNSVGASLDRADMSYYNNTSQQALNDNKNGQSLPWKNPENGHYGTVTPTNYYTASSGEYCREYTQTIRVGGQSQQAHGNACREPDGTWQIVSQ